MQAFGGVFTHKTKCLYRCRCIETCRKTYNM